MCILHFPKSYSKSIYMYQKNPSSSSSFFNHHPLYKLPPICWWCLNFTPSYFVLALLQDLDDGGPCSDNCKDVTYLKSVGASHLLLRDNCLRHHTKGWAHRRWVRPQDSRHHRPWCEVRAESATHLRHRSQVWVRCLPSTQTGSAGRVWGGGEGDRNKEINQCH